MRPPRRFAAIAKARDIFLRLGCSLALLLVFLLGLISASNAQAPAEPTAPLPGRQAPALMLAQIWQKGMPLQDYWVSEKYDGVRGYWNGRQLISRGGLPIAAPAWFTAGWPATPMDGELWAGHGQFSHAQATTAQSSPNDTAWRQMRFMVFDLPTAPGSFEQRLPVLQKTVRGIAQAWVQPVEQRQLSTDAQLQNWLSQVVKNGGEGLILHKGSATYRSGRSDDLLKLKPFDDAEARIIGYKPGRGQWQGMTGALLVQSPEGKQFSLGSGLTADLRQNPPPLGSWVTYRYQGLHDKSGLPRFARFLRVRNEPGFSPEQAAPRISNS